MTNTLQPEPIVDLENYYDVYNLTRELDRVKSQVFLGNGAAFLGPLMCAMDFVWTKDIPTAATNGVTVWWNPDWFLQMPMESRKTVLIHELRHVAYMHLSRVLGRDHKIFNYACDYVINNELDSDGYSFEGTGGGLINHDFDGMNAEAVYEHLISNPPPMCAPWGPGITGDEIDMYPGDIETQQKAINNVIQASHTARISGHPGDIPGEVELLLEKFLAPKVAWEAALQQFFMELGEDDYSWARPNRRYQEMYLPSKIPDFNGLAHLAYYLDVSGSVSDGDVLRFNSEVKHIKDTFNPELLSLIQFDTRITHVDEFTRDDPFEKVIVVGRGGTHLGPVYADIMERKPTAAIIFSDLYCEQMADPGIPVIWVVVGNRNAQVNFGRKIHIGNE